MTSHIPKEYSISLLSAEVQNKFVFSQTEHGKTISGTVHHECVAVPTEANAYRNIMRKRVREAGTPQRTTQVLGQNNQPVFVPGASSAVPSSDFSDFVVSIKYFFFFLHFANHFADIQKTKNRQQRKSNTYAKERTYGFTFCSIRQIPILVI